MENFILSAEVTISIITEVVATSLEDAIEIAQQREIENSNWNDSEQRKNVWVSSEYDGEPKNIKEV